MVDLVILLIISVAVMAAFGLVVAGFVWAPWLIGLVLVVLLVALMRIAGSSEQQLLAELDQTGEVVSPEVPTTSQEAQEEATEPVMYYRGVKYKRSESQPTQQSAPSEQAINVECKYRGHPWKPSA